MASGPAPADAGRLHSLAGLDAVSRMTKMDRAGRAAETAMGTGRERSGPAGRMDPPGAKMKLRDKQKLVIAEPLWLVREGFAALCRAGGECEVVGQCEDGEAAVELVESAKPDAAILDLDLQRLYTLELIRKLRRSAPNTRFVVLGTRTDSKTVVEVLRAGASAYLLKSGPAEHLFEALRRIRDGSVYVSPLLSLEKIFITGSTKKTGDPLDALSTREYEVFTLLVEGIRAKEIAARLELSPKTVDTYRASLMRKLEIHDVAGLVKYAIKRKLTPAS